MIRLGMKLGLVHKNMARRTFGSKREKVTDRWKILQSIYITRRLEKIA